MVFEDIGIEFDCIWLLNQVKVISSIVEHHTKNAYESVFITLRGGGGVNISQLDNNSSETYIERFRDGRHTLELAGIAYLYHLILKELI